MDDQDRDIIAGEKLLGFLDGAAAGAIERLAYGLLLPPSPRDRTDLSYWFGCQYVRDPRSRRRWEAMADAVMKMHLPEPGDAEAARRFLRTRHGREPTAEEMERFEEVLLNLDKLEAVPPQNDAVKMVLDAAERYGPAFYSRSWSVLRFSEPGLATSDHPLVLYQHLENRDPFFGVGLGTADEISFPLDRQNLLVMHFDEGPGERLIKVPAERLPADWNQMLVAQAHDEVYCHPDDVAQVQALEWPRPDRPFGKLEGGAWGARPDPDGINSPPVRTRPRRYREARNVDRT